MVARLGEVMWVVDLNRQSLDRVVPDIAAGRLAAMFEAAGWHTVMVKYGPLLRQAPGRCAPASTRCPTRSTSGSCAPTRSELRTRIEVDVDDLDDAELLATFRDLGGHDLAAPDRRLPPGRRGPRPPERRLRLHDQGLVAADRGPPRQPLGAAQPRAVPRARGQARRGRRRPVRAARRRLARGGAVRARPARGSSAARPAPSRAPKVPPDLGRKHTGTASTQQAFGRFFVDLAREAPEVAERVVTVSPDVGTSTNLGGWINKAGIWNVGDRIDWFADDTDTLVRWREYDHGRHIELGIAEVNLVGAAGRARRDLVARRPAAAAGRHDLRPVRGARAGAVVVRHLRRRPVDPRRHAVAASRSAPRAARTSR